MPLDGPIPKLRNPARPGEVLIWLVDTSAPGHRRAADGQALTPSERAELDRLPGPHKGRFAVTRLALRRLVGCQLSIDPEAVVIVRSERRRPELDPLHGRSLSISLSYAGDLALVAIADSVSIGVDIERIQPIAEQDAIVASRFSSAEKSAWARLAPQARLAAFYDAWTRKEAVVKAMGIGLAMPLDRLTVTFGPDELAQVIEIDGCRAAHWSLVDIADIPGHKAALAARSALGASEPLLPLVVRRLPD